MYVMNKNITYYGYSKLALREELLSIASFADSNGLAIQFKQFEGCSQTDFMIDIHRDLAVIVDATIPNDLKEPTIYPILTAHVNILITLFCSAEIPTRKEMKYCL